MRTYEEKKQNLYGKMKEYTKQDICIAFSGGVDSSLLLMMAKECMQQQKKKGKIHAVTFHTVLHPPCDLEIANKVAKEADAVHKVIFVNELEQEEIRFNPENRCYLCKKTLFQRLIEYAKSQGISVIMEGTNEDDLHVYRPGLRAIKELEVLSPLAEVGFTKAEVRKLAEELGTSVASRPSTPCLATRLPYGTEIKTEALEKIACGEEYLKKQGFSVVRIRLHGEICRIELPKTDFGTFLEKSQEITETLQKIGFQYITLDVQGFRSGSMDEFRNKSCQEKILDR